MASHAAGASQQYVPKLDGLGTREISDAQDSDYAKATAVQARQKMVVLRIEANAAGRAGGCYRLSTNDFASRKLTPVCAR